MTASDPFEAKGMMRTQHGWVSLLDPKPEQIHMEDILYSLGRARRFSGHSDITVLEHSVRAYLMACHFGVEDPQILKTVLMHDAHEAFVTDMSNPMKNAMRMVSDNGSSIYDEIEHMMMKAVAEKFGLIYPHPPEVQRADMAALSAEVEIIWGPLEVEAWKLDRVERVMDFYNSWQIRQCFNIYFNNLTKEIEEAA